MISPSRLLSFNADLERGKKKKHNVALGSWDSFDQHD